MKTRYIVLAGLGIVLGLWLAQPTYAQVYVTTTDDELNTDGDCSLREAIQAANTDSPVDNCIISGSPGSYQVIYLEGLTYTLSIPGVNENANQTGDLDITVDASIEGIAAAPAIINAAGIDRAFHTLRGYVRIVNVMFINGNTEDDGGCILVGSHSQLALEYAGVYNCLAGNFGGGIYIAPGASLDIFSSEIAENSAGNGGGIFVDNNAWIPLISSTTIRNNHAAGTGGGIDNRGVIATIVNTTISSNIAGSPPPPPPQPIGTGSGIWNNGTINDVSHVTIAFNRRGPAIFSSLMGHFNNIRSSIIANNEFADCGQDRWGPHIISGGYNILSDDSCSDVFTNTGDLLNTDPMLGPLQNNGGPTKTHALLPGSPAIDHVDEFICPPPDKDQRGVPRPTDGDGDSIARCDSGAFELERPVDVSITKSDTSYPVGVGEDLTYTIVVTNNGPEITRFIRVHDRLPLGVEVVSFGITDVTPPFPPPDPNDPLPPPLPYPACEWDMFSNSIDCWFIRKTFNPGQQTATITIIVRPTDDVAGEVIRNCAQVFVLDGDDPNPDNNESCVETRVQGRAGIIRGFKWLDLDGDGHRNVHLEPLLRGITIRVIGIDNSINATAVTDAQGRFVFALPPGMYLVCEVRPDVISYQTFPRNGPICPDSEFPGWEIMLGDGEIREIAFGNVFDELYFEPTALGSAIQAVPQRDGILFRPQHAFLVKELQVEIYDLHGRVIYRSPWASDGVLWTLKNERGQRVARGVYLYVVTIRAVDGSVITSRVQKLIAR